VCYILALQAVFFYLPKCLWDNLEGDRVQMLLNQAKSFLSESEFQRYPLTESRGKGTELFTYLTAEDKLGKQNSYFWKLVFCEFLNLLVAGLQIFATNMFLGFELTSVTIRDLIGMMSVNDPFSREDNVAQIFPTVSKCTFNQYGPSGGVENRDALCVLPFNVIHEKIYVAMW
jgi:hypothetical protein